MAKIRFLGHAAFYIEGKGLKGLIDPFLKDNPQSVAYPEDFKELNYIFVTHGHADHLGDAIPIAKSTGATIISCFEIANYCSTFGVSVHPMHIGGRTRFDFGRVKMTPAVHGSGISTDSGIVYGGNPGGFVIEVDGKKLYHAGDTGLIMDMKLLAEEDIDVALLPIGGNFVMDVEDAIKATDFIRPKVVVPMHYNTWPVIEADPNEFAEGVKSLSVKCKIMQPGDELVF